MGGHVTIATYNIHGFPWIRTPIRDIVRWIISHVDIVALQEVWTRHAEWSAAFAVHGWYFLRPPRESHLLGIFGSGLAFAWKTSLWSHSDARFYPFLSSMGLDSLVTKGWFAVQLRHGPTDTPLRLLNTHMQADYDVSPDLWLPQTEAVRMAQCQQLYTTEERMHPITACPTFVIGDLNTEECWFPRSTWLTPNSVTFPSTQQSLDHCVDLFPTSANGITLRDHQVHTRVAHSDHFPVSWTFHIAP